MHTPLFSPFWRFILSCVFQLVPFFFGTMDAAGVMFGWSIYCVEGKRGWTDVYDWDMSDARTVGGQ